MSKKDCNTLVYASHLSLTSPEVVVRAAGTFGRRHYRDTVPECVSRGTSPLQFRTFFVASRSRCFATLSSAAAMGTLCNTRRAALIFIEL